MEAVLSKLPEEVAALVEEYAREVPTPSAKAIRCSLADWEGYNEITASPLGYPTYRFTTFVELYDRIRGGYDEEERWW